MPKEKREKAMKLVDRLYTTLIALAGLLLSPGLWAHPFGYHEEGFIMLHEHVHTEPVSSWWLLVAFLLAAVVLHLTGRLLKGRLAWFVRTAILAASGGAALLIG
jgi:hypothetical protein